MARVRNPVAALRGVLHPIRVRRRVRRLIPPEQFARLGERSFIQPPLTVVGPEWLWMGDDVVIGPGALISIIVPETARPDGPLVTIGDGTRLGGGLVIAACGSVEIGPRVLASERVFIGDTFHDYRDPTRAVIDQPLADPRPVRIGEGAFLGIGSAVLPGVTIGEGACVGANSVVTADLPPRTVAVGSPARVVRRWDEAAGAWIDVRA